MAEIVGSITTGIVVLALIFFTCGGPEWVSELLEGRRRFKLEQLRIKHSQARADTTHPHQGEPPHRIP